MINKNNKNKNRKIKRQRVRNKINGTQDRPRLSVYRSTNHIHAQVINDIEGKTLVSA